jgi:asparagine synthase (glutamine-hydrolysing)
MCGIAGIISLEHSQIPGLEHKLRVMNDLQRHRGPDGEGYWIEENRSAGFAHLRLSIIDLATGDQPMCSQAGDWIVFNGEIYNYIELRQELSADFTFVTKSDTEVILYAYRKWGADCVNHLRGMFAFALWDTQKQELFCARDRFGIKPLYYTVVDRTFFFASEIKTLLPFLDAIETDTEGLKDYLFFQFCLAGKTLFKHVNELLPGHTLMVKNGSVRTDRYWEVYYNLDYSHTAQYFEEHLRELLVDSVNIHLRSDVPLGGYISGGLDSSSIASLANNQREDEFLGFTGKFRGEAYDESPYARALAETCQFKLHEIEITAQDFIDNIQKVIYHLDYPVAGPGSFPQYMVSELASHHRKVVLGGQGGDEIFGGYTRYLIAYFEQCIKAAIDGTSNNGNFVVTYESIIPNLTALRNYKPLLQEFWREGLFAPMDQRYFRLVNRAPNLDGLVDWEELGDYSSFEAFKKIFNSNNVRKESYFDLMTHFDFKTLLPALLQIEDRVSMAHGLESRVPILDHPLIEFAATIPADSKFKEGDMKHVFKKAVKPFLPELIYNRTDKMGFPTPLTDWVNGEARSFVMDIFNSQAARSRQFVHNERVMEKLDQESKFGRTIWGLLSLELWQREFHDRQSEFKKLLVEVPV